MYPTTSNNSATSPERKKFVASVASQNYSGPSVVDYLNKSGYDSSPASRMALANDYGIKDYGVNPNNADANTRLLAALRGGSTSPSPSPAGADTTISNQNPATTVDPNAGMSKSDLAFKTYLESMKETPEESSARAYLSRLMSDSKMANEKALNSGETMGYAMGEAARIKRNNDLTIDAATGAYDALNAGNKNRQAIAKATYDYEATKEKAAKDALAAKKGFDLSQGQQRYEYNPKTNKYELVASVAPKPLSTKSSGISYTQSKTMAKDEMESGINRSLAALENYRVTNNQSGFDPTKYNQVLSDINNAYGPEGVAFFRKQMKDAGYELDENGDAAGNKKSQY